MIIDAEYRGMKSEEITYTSKKTSREETMALHTVYLEQDEAGVEAFQFKVRDEDSGKFKSLRKGQRVKIVIKQQRFSLSELIMA